ncbi:hypothetical protein [Roseisolibacter sp. H3M3-2]|uniref:hypothetical protein n=1 Tax=Roseisolibacter sp. H3M3-2 TaxID=3031323 RepID=UPI0023DC7BDD|nr:hypothetical protein [Roseisolibacter sp. H3M3-2]MDF1504599.1 hypothetical protein [Roseisolibacter sp. H3M3-2]
MLLLTALLLAAGADTVRLEVGAPLADAGVLTPHAARVRVREGSDSGQVVAEWTNALTVGDSAGVPVHRWVTRGTVFGPGGERRTWEILQTYHARTLAPLGYRRSSSDGAGAELTIDGRRVRGTRRGPGGAAAEPVDLQLDRAGFIASASDLVPLAAGLAPGRVVVAPVWGPGMTAAQGRVFTVVGEEALTVEGAAVRAFRVDEREERGGRLVASWWLTRTSPFMVYGKQFGADGSVRVMSEVAVPMDRVTGPGAPR